MKINLSPRALEVPEAWPLPFMRELGWKGHAPDDRRLQGGRAVTRR